MSAYISAGVILLALWGGAIKLSTDTQSAWARVDHKKIYFVFCASVKSIDEFMIITETIYAKFCNYFKDFDSI
jgi:hypothetical protein